MKHSLLLSVCIGIAATFVPFATAAQPPKARPNACSDFVEYATRGKSQDSLKTDSLLVLKDGKTAYEYYDGFYKAETPHCLFSGTKSFVSTLLGIAVRQGKLSLDQKIVDLFPEALALRPEKDPQSLDAFKRITIYDLLSMQSGITWREIDGVTLRWQTGLKMLFTTGALDTLSFFFKQPMTPDGPSRVWAYSSGSSVALAAALQKVYGAADTSFPWRELLDKLNMKNAIFSRDMAGNFLGSDALYVTLRDMAKLGTLYLNDGVWKGTRLLPEGWTRLVRKRAPALASPSTMESEILNLGVYGGGFWLNQPVPEKNLLKPFPNSPDDVYYAAGHYGQLVIIIPSLRMVIARTGHDEEFHSKIDGLISRAIACYGSETAKGDAP